MYRTFLWILFQYHVSVYPDKDLWQCLFETLKQYMTFSSLDGLKILPENYFLTQLLLFKILFIGNTESLFFHQMKIGHILGLW